jgi:predicted RNase H-like nuclease
MAEIAGVDGCPKGWIIAIQDTKTSVVRCELAENFPQLLDVTDGFAVVGLDMPIGLLSSARKGGRACDTIARRLLKSPRASSIFSAPSRPALSAVSYEEANALNRRSSPDNLGLSRQSYSIMPKIIEVDRCMTPERQKVVKEVHPELCFYALNNNLPAKYSKKKSKGIEVRCNLLKKYFKDFKIDSGLDKRDVKPDDFLDAFVALWTARRIYEGSAERIPEESEQDSRGLLMEMWR